MIFADTHCHLGSRQFDEDRDSVIGRMLKMNITKAIIICCSRHDLQAALRLREENPGFRIACSIHPQDLAENHDQSRLEELEQVIREVHPDMIGETGLDYYSHPHTKEHQLHFFASQLDLAEKYHLPVNIHCRRAAADTYRMLKERNLTGIIHSYSGSYESAMEFIRTGYYISFGASVLFAGAKRPKQVVSKIPPDRLLIETDSPYQSPVRDHRHEPADIIRIYEEIASLRGISIEELAQAAEENFDRTFSGAGQPASR